VSEYVHQPQLMLVTHRCVACGTFWAIESGRRAGNEVCPRCASIRISEYIAIAERAQRQVNSYRGILKRKRA
jgi:predicted RNA-binding Zn-ribbon protein involved in translation (DUF1610 family)